MNEERHYRESIQVASLYYYQGLTTEKIAMEMGISRPKVSRLLSFARSSGMVEIKIVTNKQTISPLEDSMRETFGLSQVHIVPAPELLGEAVWLERTARFAANYLNSILHPGDTLAIAWGTTISEIADNLIPKRIADARVVQLNGSGNTYSPDNRYAADILHRFADNYEASVTLFPVPTFFDYRETKELMWRERSIRRIIDIQQSADVLLYSIGAVNAGIPSHVYTHGYLEPADVEDLSRQGVVGDLATVFFRSDGTFDDIPLNHRASGPPLTLYQQAKRAICVVSGFAKVDGILAALRARYMTELIIDEPTARLLCKKAACLPEGGSQ